jgi:hypothetical protein
VRFRPWKLALLFVPAAILLFFGIGMTVTGYKVAVAEIILGLAYLVGGIVLTVRDIRWDRETRARAAEDLDGVD